MHEKTQEAGGLAMERASKERKGTGRRARLDHEVDMQASVEICERACVSIFIISCHDRDRGSSYLLNRVACLGHPIRDEKQWLGPPMHLAVLEVQLYRPAAAAFQAVDQLEARLEWVVPLVRAGRAKVADNWGPDSSLPCIEGGRFILLTRAVLRVRSSGRKGVSDGQLGAADCVEVNDVADVVERGHDMLGGICACRRWLLSWRSGCGWSERKKVEVQEEGVLFGEVLGEARPRFGPAAVIHAPADDVTSTWRTPARGHL